MGWSVSTDGTPILTFPIPKFQRRQCAEMTHVAWVIRNEIVYQELAIVDVSIETITRFMLSYQDRCRLADGVFGGCWQQTDNVVDITFGRARLCGLWTWPLQGKFRPKRGLITRESLDLNAVAYTARAETRESRRWRISAFWFWEECLFNLRGTQL